MLDGKLFHNRSILGFAYVNSWLDGNLILHIVTHVYFNSILGS